MKLSLTFLKPKKESTLYYLALLLTAEKVNAVVLEEIEGKIKILGKQYASFDTTIEDVPLETLIERIDYALSKALEVMPANVEIRKTVFGVKENWVEEDSKKIKKEYLQKLKKVCDSLELSPIGFMVVSEAIANLLQQDEGVPLSAILAELGKNIVTLTLFRGGKIIQTVEGKMEGSRILTVNSLLNRFTIEVLPARIILYDTEIDEVLVQQFIRHQWSKTLPFLHMPQISVLPADFESRAVAFGAAVQMGFAVVAEDKKSVRNYEHGIAPATVVTPANNEETEEAFEQTSSEEITDTADNLMQEDDFGFVTDQDIADIGEPPANDEFVDGDMEIVAKPLPAAISPTHHHHSAHANLVMPTHLKEDTSIEADEEDIIETSERKSKFSFGVVGGLFKKLKLPSLRRPAFSSLGIAAIVVPIILVVLLAGGGYYFYTNQVSASVILNLKPKDITQTKDVVFIADADNDFSGNILSGTSVEGTLDGDMTAPATGKKEVGDKAKGTVTLYNGDLDSSASIPKGTTIKSSNGLGFVTDKDVSVASASGNKYTGTKPGTAKVDVTADAIGTKHNLPSGTEFSIGGSSQLAARNEGAFSGGTSKMVTVVSKDDLAKLRADLLESLEAKSQDALLQQKPTGGVVLPIVLSTDLESAKFDKNDGDEAKNVTLTATLAYTGLAYKERDIKNFAKEILENEHGKSMTFAPDDLQISLKNAQKNEDNEVSAQAVIKASLLPKIQTPELAKKLSGKPRKEAEDMLSDLPQVEDTVIEYRPNISFLAKLFPRLPSHVTITVSSD